MTGLVFVMSLFSNIHASSAVNISMINNEGDKAVAVYDTATKKTYSVQAKTKLPVNIVMKKRLRITCNGKTQDIYKDWKGRVKMTDGSTKIYSDGYGNVFSKPGAKRLDGVSKAKKLKAQTRTLLFGEAGNIAIV